VWKALKEAKRTVDATGGPGLNAPIASHPKSDSDRQAAERAKLRLCVEAATQSGGKDQNRGKQP
jgi:hypothetical protein